MSFRPLTLSCVLVVFLCAASLPLAAVHAGVAESTLRLSPLDTSLKINNTNYSTDPILMTYTWPDNQVANAILLKFDLSSLPSGALVHEATLHLALVTADPTLDLNYTVAAHKVVNKNPVIEAATGYTADGDAGWTPNGCCYNGVPLAQADISPPEDSTTVDKVPGFKSWTVTTMVQEWLAEPATNLGLVLNSDPAQPRDRYRYFASTENPLATLHPYLEVSYSLPVVDTTAPSVTITAPGSGASVAQTIALAALAADDGGVAGVQFQLDGLDLASEDTTPPYSLSWDTTTTSDGSHTLTATARDAAGNRATSDAVPITVSNASDATAPSVVITAPVDGASVTDTITIAANAADTGGVAGVQFQVDGVNLGAEDTTQPYSVTWNTAASTEGPHALTAIARDIAGNAATSAAITVAVNGSGGAAVVFDSDWATAVGTSTAAVSDGGLWPHYWEFNNGTGVQLLSVVAGGPDGHNALRVQQRGSSYAANLQIDDVVPQSQDYYLRFYMRNDDTSSAGDHAFTVDTWHYSNLTFLRKYSGASDWRLVISMYGCGEHYPFNHWGPPGRLARGQWYRFEYFVDFVDASHVQVHPRVYDASGSLLYSDDAFRQQDYGSTVWNGRNDWTLASYYAAGYSFCVNPAFVNDIGLGNNGQASATSTGLYWYFAAVQIRTDTWPGPVSPPESGVLPVTRFEAP